MIHKLDKQIEILKECRDHQKQLLPTTVRPLQPVLKKTRLEIVLGMENEILIGIEKILLQVSFHLKITNWILFCLLMTISSLIFSGTGLFFRFY